MISFKRGTPSVTFMLATPAKWKVLSVICVPGSEMLCAPIAPTACTQIKPKYVKTTIHGKARGFDLTRIKTIRSQEDVQAPDWWLQIAKG